MSRLLGPLLCACLIACGIGQAAHASPMYVYRGAGCTGVANMPAWTSFISTRRPAKADGAVDFVPFDSWTDFDGQGLPTRARCRLNAKAPSEGTLGAGRFTSG